MTDAAGRPNAHVFTATSESDKAAKTAELEKQGPVTSVQPTQVLKSLDTLAPADQTDDAVFNRRSTSSDGQATILTTSIAAADGHFAQSDIGAVITDSAGDLAPGTTITNVSSMTAATISAPAIGTTTTDVFTITGRRSTVADGQTSSSTSITAADAGFTSHDVGSVITDSLGDIPPGTTITGVSSTAMATISKPATGTHVNDVFTFTNQPVQQQWSLSPYPGANFGAAWATEAGQSQRIAIVDTGVDLTHQSFAGQVVAGPDFSSQQDGSHPVTGDPDGHGTHTAGIAGARDIDSNANATINGAAGSGDTLGGAPNATVVAVRVLDAHGNGFDGDVANGISWAATPSTQTFMNLPGGNASVISLSLGGDCPGADLSLILALQTAKRNGVVVVAAAGNGASGSNCGVPEFPGAYSTGSTTSVIAVASTRSDGTKSDFSNCGSYVNIAAPGESILSSFNGSNTDYEILSGTSMSTPLVAAAAALVKEQCPGMSPDDVKNELIHHAGPPVAGFSFPHLDAGAALAANCAP